VGSRWTGRQLASAKLVPASLLFEVVKQQDCFQSADTCR